MDDDMAPEEFRDHEERALDALDHREHILGSIEAMHDMEAEELYEAIDITSRHIIRLRGMIERLDEAA